MTKSDRLTWQLELLGEEQRQPSEGVELRLHVLLLQLQPECHVLLLDRAHEASHEAACTRIDTMHIKGLSQTLENEPDLCRTRIHPSA